MDRDKVASLLVVLMFVLGVTVGLMIDALVVEADTTQRNTYRCSEQQLQEAQPQFSLCVLEKSDLPACVLEVKQLYCTKVQEVQRVPSAGQACKLG